MKYSKTRKCFGPIWKAGKGRVRIATATILDFLDHTLQSPLFLIAVD